VAPGIASADAVALGPAMAALHPARLGLRPHAGGWRKDVPGLGTVAFAPLSWPHAHAASNLSCHQDPHPGSALDLLVDLQRQVWGLPPEDVVPANLLAVLPDTGGSVLVAYRADVGFTRDGWLGFAIAAGARGGTLVSHMLGVREHLRGRFDLGWQLKALQGFEALRTGHPAATWTFDPMRGANARLNLEKLGARAIELTLDKYGVLRSTLYGDDVPTDRLVAYWDLVDPATARRLHAVHDGRFRGPDPSAVAALPEATPANLPEIVATEPRRLRYRIPGDVDRIARRAPEEALRLRREMRSVLSSLLTTRAALSKGDGSTDPLAVSVGDRPGPYVVTGFATGLDPDGERTSFYLLERRAG
jgi:predicted GNAT superfamily acetyltransferase